PLNKSPDSPSYADESAFPPHADPASPASPPPHAPASPESHPSHDEHSSVAAHPPAPPSPPSEMPAPSSDRTQFPSLPHPAQDFRRKIWVPHLRDGLIVANRGPYQSLLMGWASVGIRGANRSCPNRLLRNGQ